MRTAVKNDLRDAWFGAETTAQIIGRVGLSDRTIERFWKGEKIAGRLPDYARPYFAKFCRVSDDALDDAESDAGDRAISPRRNRKATDAMLAALQEAHGGDPLRAFDLIPKQTLQMEINGYPPSQPRLQEFNAARDRYADALIARRAGVPLTLEQLAEKIDGRNGQ